LISDAVVRALQFAVALNSHAEITQYIKTDKKQLNVHQQSI